MSAVQIEDAFDDFTLRAGELAAMAAVSPVRPSDFDRYLITMSTVLGAVLTAQDLDQLRRAAHTLTRTVAEDPWTSSGHADFREAVAQVKSAVLRRSLGVNQAG